YFLIERDMGGDEDEADDEDTTNKTPITVSESKLQRPLQDLVSLICSVNMMEQQMAEIGYDSKKLPLGKLSKNNIKKGYEVLQKISMELAKAAPSRTRVASLLPLPPRFSIDTIIPHEFGMRRPEAIADAETLKRKIDMVEALADIEIATKLLKKKVEDASENPIDRSYRSLNCGLVPLEKNSETFDLIVKYAKNTHAETHRQYELEMLDIFEVDRHGEAERFDTVGRKIHNRQLLWHGSRLTNFVGILSQGLRIAPPEAPVTGYMFGKGVYFADMVSKSANYCFTSQSNPIGILLLCEVSLGDQLPLLKSDYNADTAVEDGGFHSTKGVGRTAPNPAEAVTLPDGVVVPCGKPAENKDAGPHLLYNEHIVGSDVVCVRGGEGLTGILETFTFGNALSAD
ncbi:poly polymerase catalytic domain-containing protein, partial [Blyttiomyces helicus]